MTTKRIFLSAVVLFFTLSLFGQNAENNTVKNRSNELGIHAGFTTGLGLSFRHWSEKFGVQITAIPIKSNDFKFISGGLTAMYSITNQKYHRFFLYLGNHVLIYDDLIDFDDLFYNEVTTEYKYNIGFGPGFEVGRNVRFNIMVGYGAYNLLEPSEYKLLPAVEMGLYFKL